MFVPLQSTSDDDEIVAAKELYLKAFELTGKDSYLVRSATGLPMIMRSVERAIQDREKMNSDLDTLLQYGLK